MISDVHDEVLSELKNRATWEDRQATWFKMRYQGIPRAKKPYPNAPDMHYPLGDTMIEKLKPFYISLIYIQERLSAFTSGKPQTPDTTSLGERLFDYVLKQKTNFERSLHTAVDYMLMYGRCPVKIYWSTELKKLCYNPIRPIYIITPSWTEELVEADWIIHVQHLSEAEYRRNKNLKQNDALIKRIKGKGDSRNSGTNTQEQASYQRQGITYGQSDNQIVLWECYTREGDKIVIDTISPILGPDEPIRDNFGMPYEHGQPPFADLRYELADADYYSPRGIVEILSQDELSLCKLWNHKLQYLDFFGQPIFKNSGTAANPQNFQNTPGRILPPGVEPLPPQGAPLDFKDEMQTHRALAEDRIQIPDLSAGEHLVGKRGAKGGTTATQINALLGQSTSGNDMRARIFRLQLATLYAQSWSLICQYMPKSERILEDFTPVPEGAMHTDYGIAPSGSADSYSKEQRVAKAMAYKQALTGDPSIKQNELTKWMLEQDDSSLVKRLYQEPQEAAQDQAEDQAEEIVLMLNGYSAPRVKPDDDDKAHVMSMAKWVEWRSQSGQPIPPTMAQWLIQHGQAHQQQMMHKRDKQGMAMFKSDPAVLAAIQQLEAIISQAQQQQQTADPQNGMQGGPQMPPGPPQGGAPQQEPPASARESISISYKDAPPSVQRQMEQAAGFQPASMQEAITAEALRKSKPAPTAAPAKAQ